MSGIDDDSVNLIYADPPFNSNKNYAAPIGSVAEGAKFLDTWNLTDEDEAWLEDIRGSHPDMAGVIEIAGRVHSKGMQSYLTAMGVRLLEMRRVLKPTGSLYYHCDPTASHYTKILLDEVFGKENYRNEIVWHYNKWTNTARYFQKNNDTIFFYSKSDNYTFNKQYVMTEHKRRVLRKGYDSNVVEGGVKQLLVYDWDNLPDKVRDDPKYHRIVDLSDKPKGVAASQVWSDINYLSSASKERTGYPTQKPLALLERIINASSNPDDLVLDPFCGCTTTCIAAEKLGRGWIGIDVSPLAGKLIMQRLSNELGLPGVSPYITSEYPVRSDWHNLPHYRTHFDTLYGKQGGDCNGCRTHFLKHNLEVDHIRPRSQGGRDNIENLQLLCSYCNRTKGQDTHEMLLARLRKQGII